MDELVDEFNVEEDLAPDGVVRRPYLLEMEKRIDRSEEGTVQPTSTLGDELGNRVCCLLVHDRVG